MKMTFKPIVALILCLSLLTTASAQVTCNLVHIPETSKRVRITDGLIHIEEAAGTAEQLAKGKVTFDERPLPADTQKALMELVYLATWTRATKISENLVVGKDQGRLTLGFELKDGYSLEVVYSSDYRHEALYQDPKAYVISKRGGSKEAIPLMNIDGSFRFEKSIELENYVDIADKNFHISLPAKISGNVITELIANIKALDLFADQAKFDLREVSGSGNYAKFKFALIKKTFLTKAKEYWIEKGFFKQTAKVIYPVLGFLTLWGAIHYYPTEVVALKDTVINSITVKPVDWAIESMNRFARKEGLSQDIKNQIEEVASDLTLYKANTPAGIQLAPEMSANLNFPGKFVLNKQQYMWVENIFNTNTNTTDAVLVITQDNRNGVVTTFMGKIDTDKYQKLITFLKARGQINTVEEGG